MDFYGSEVEKHLRNTHNGIDDPTMWQNSLDWLVIIPGGDHIRLNAVKAVVSLYWDAYFKDIAVELGYTSPSALETAKSCQDLHKADMMMSVMMESGAQTLARFYEDEKKHTNAKTPENFLNFMEETTNPNVSILYQLGEQDFHES